MKQVMKIIMVVVIGFFVAQPTDGTTVSQVLNDLHRQNFSQKTLDSIENLLDLFVDQDDRLNSDIAPRPADKKRLKHALAAELSQSWDNKYSRAIWRVQQILNVEKKLRNVSGPMVVTTEGERDLCRKKMLDFLRLFFPHMGYQKSLNLLQNFLDEIRGGEGCTTISPKKETLKLLQNFAHENHNYPVLTDGILGEVTHGHTIQLKKDYFKCVIKRVSEFALEDYPLFRANDNLKFIVHKFVMKCVIANFYDRTSWEDFWYSDIRGKAIGCFDVFIAYLMMFSPKTLIEMYQFNSYMRCTVEIVDARKALDLFKGTLDLCSSNCLPKFNKDLSKKTYLIKDYDGCWFGGDDAHLYSSRVFYGSGDEEGEEYPWWVYAPKDTYNRDTVFEYY